MSSTQPLHLLSLLPSLYPHLAFAPAPLLDTMSLQWQSCWVVSAPQMAPSQISPSRHLGSRLHSTLNYPEANFDLGLHFTGALHRFLCCRGAHSMFQECYPLIWMIGDYLYTLI